MIRCILLVIFFLASGSGIAKGEERYPSLWDRSDPVLQQQLDTIMGILGFDGAIRDKRLAVTLVDISDLENPRVASVNGNTMLYAASVPKRAILLGAFVEIENGAIILDEETRQSLTEMIRFSSNLEATRMLNRVGKIA